MQRAQQAAREKDRRAREKRNKRDEKRREAQAKSRKKGGKLAKGMYRRALSLTSCFFFVFSILRAQTTSAQFSTGGDLISCCRSKVRH